MGFCPSVFLDQNVVPVINFAHLVETVLQKMSVLEEHGRLLTGIKVVGMGLVCRKVAVVII